MARVPAVVNLDGALVGVIDLPVVCTPCYINFFIVCTPCYIVPLMLNAAVLGLLLYVSNLIVICTPC